MARAPAKSHQELFAYRYGAAPAAPYTWSEDKARQYSKPERANFGAFIRAKGFRLN